MSATFDTELFGKYFSRLIGGKIEKAPVVVVEGRSYDVSEYYLDDLSELGIPVSLSFTLHIALLKSHFQE